MIIPGRWKSFPLRDRRPVVRGGNRLSVGHGYGFSSDDVQCLYHYLLLVYAGGGILVETSHIK